MMKKQVLKQLKALHLGDLVEVFWHDASKGEARIDERSEEVMQFDIPVRSVGYFLGLAGRRVKHVILIRDSFQLNEAEGVYDVDFNVVPLGMIYGVNVAFPNALDAKVVLLLRRAFLRARTRKQKGRLVIYAKESHK